MDYLQQQENATGTSQPNTGDVSNGENILNPPFPGIPDPIEATSKDAPSLLVVHSSPIDYTGAEDRSLEKNAVPLLRFTPVLLCAVWYCCYLPWHLLRCDTKYFELRLLYEQILAIDRQLLLDITAPGSHKLALSAFKDITEVINSGVRSRDIAHGILRCVLLDRLLWARNNGDGKQPYPLQVAYWDMPYLPQHEGINKFFNYQREWKSTISSFSREWDKRKDKSTNSTGRDQPAHATDATVSLPKHDAIMISLLQSAFNLNTRVHLLTVQTNFCYAALALRLLLKHVQPDSPMTLRDYVQKDLLESGKADEETLRSLEKFDDYDLLRTLYTAVVVSPIALLGSIKVGMGGSAQLRVPLYLMAHYVCAPTLEYDANRMSVEKDLWNVIWRMNELGNDVFESEMLAALEKWRSMGLIESQGREHRNSGALSLDQSQQNPLATALVKKKWDESRRTIEQTPSLATSLPRFITSYLKEQDNVSSLVASVDPSKGGWLNRVVAKLRAEHCCWSRPVQQNDIENPSNDSSTPVPIPTPISSSALALAPISLSSPAVASTLGRSSSPTNEVAFRSASNHPQASPTAQSSHGWNLPDGEHQLMEYFDFTDATLFEQAATGESGSLMNPMSPHNPIPPPLGMNTQVSALPPTGSGFDSEPATQKESAEAPEGSHSAVTPTASTNAPTASAAAGSASHASSTPSGAGPLPNQAVCTLTTDQPPTPQHASVSHMEDGTRKPGRYTRSQDSSARAAMPSPAVVGTKGSKGASSSAPRSTRSTSTKKMKLGMIGKHSLRQSPRGQTGSSVKQTWSSRTQLAAAPRKKPRRIVKSRTEMKIENEKIPRPDGGAPNGADDDWNLKCIEMIDLTESSPHTAEPLEEVPDNEVEFMGETKELHVKVAVNINGSIVWRDETFKLPKWDAMEKLWTELDVISERMSFDGEGKPGSIRTFAREAWEALPEAERRKMFQTYNIHVVTQEGTIPPHAIMPNIRDWDADQIRSRFATDEVLFVHNLSIPTPANSPNDRLRKSTMEKFLSEQAKAKLKGMFARFILNYLEIRMSGVSGVSTPVTDFDDTTWAANHRALFYQFRTLWDKDSFLWALLSTQGSISETHMDSGGYATFVRPLLGHKLWISALDQMTPTLGGWPIKTVQWQAVVLSPQDDFFMRPGTAHFVVTLDDCLVVGGHLHSVVTADETLRAMVLEHYFGPAIVNAEHPSSGIGFLRLICRYRGIFNYGPEYIEKFLLHRLPTSRQLAFLVVLVWNMHQLFPLLSDTSVVAQWTDQSSFKSDFKYCKQALTELIGKVRTVHKERYPTFDHELKNAENYLETLAKRCEKLQKYRTLRMHLVSLAISQSPDEGDGVETTQSDSRMDIDN